MSEPFIAEVRMWGCNFAPRGWGDCSGQLLPIAQNTALFSLVGTTYGGDGRTTLALPNLNARAPMHAGRGPGLSLCRLGQYRGANEIELVVSQLPPHNHQLTASNKVGTSDTPDKSLFLAKDKASGEANLRFLDDAGNTQGEAMSLSMLSQNGGGQAHENRQPFLAVNFSIALVGIFPSRN